MWKTLTKKYQCKSCQIGTTMSDLTDNLNNRRNNTHSVKAMQDAIWAIWYHMQSTDKNPDHSWCPIGKDSWCGFQRDVAKKTSTYTRKNPLPKAVATAISPVFEALTAEALLSGCFHGGTQNQNEAFNTLI